MNNKQQLDNMNVVIVGHVDHGKSTIIGRLLADTKSLPKGKLEQVRERCRRNSKPFEYSFLLDALKDEQAQGITIDSARCFFKTKKRQYTIIDAPGHVEFLKNMISGAARAEAALLVIDVSEGIKENTKRHVYMLAMLGIKQVCILVNKMDVVNYDEGIYRQTVKDYTEFLRKINISPLGFIPVSGREGDNIASSSPNMKWSNQETVLDILDEFEASDLPQKKPFRMSVQDIYKFTEGGDNRRIIAGTVESGTAKIGDEVIFYPSGKRSKIKSIESFNKDTQTSISAGYAVGFTLCEEIYVKRGEVVSLADQKPPQVTSRLKTKLFWLGTAPMHEKQQYILKLGTAKVNVQIEKIVKVMDVANLTQLDNSTIEKNNVAECILSLEKPIACDLVHDIVDLGRFVIVDNYEIAGGGIITKTFGEEEKIAGSLEDSDTNNNLCTLNEKGLVVWLTGISGAGKSTIAHGVRAELIRLKKASYILDGDDLRQGLNVDLGFSAQDRNENIRRVTEVAALFKDAGIITLVSCISPFKSMREKACQKIGKDSFLEVYVKAELATCAKRDVKGLYKKADKGEIKMFTGITSPYEVPENPDILVNTDDLTVKEAVDKVLAKIMKVQEKF